MDSSSSRGMHARLPTGRKKRMGSEPANWIYGCNESGVTENGMSYQSELMLPRVSHASLQLLATVPPLESVGPNFSLPGTFTDVAAEQLLIMARMVWHNRMAIEGLCAAHEDQELKADFECFATAYCTMTSCSQLSAQGDRLRRVLSAFNRKRLAVETESWPRAGLTQLASQYKPGLLPPPMPSEYVEEGVCWWNWGRHTRHEDWLGHGYFWRPRPDGHAESLDNMAGSSADDFDMLEGGYRKLLGAKVLFADHELIRHDFADEPLDGSAYPTGSMRPTVGEASDEQVEQWLIENAAFISEGQVQRLMPGGDHHQLLGIDKLAGGVDQVVDTSGACKAGVRIRSGGRAATFLVRDEYHFEASNLQSSMLEVKGIGTHIQADHTRSPKNTGLLNFADALRELCYQKLIQRIIELEGLTEQMSCVKFYGLIDTGFKYNGINPSTGWENERCVLAVRQRQSRAFMAYEGYNFSGNLLMSGEEFGHETSSRTGCAAILREALVKWGVSAERNGPRMGRSSGDLSGEWNLQADANLSAFMDFSDFYVLPESPLPAMWKMTEQTFIDSYVLSNPLLSTAALEQPDLAERLFGTADKEAAQQKLAARLTELSADPKMVEASMGLTDEGLIKQSKPKYCMCWWMELDDSDMTKWAMARAAAATDEEPIGETIEASLPY